MQLCTVTGGRKLENRVRRGHTRRQRSHQTAENEKSRSPEPLQIPPDARDHKHNAQGATASLRSGIAFWRGLRGAFLHGGAENRYTNKTSGNVHLAIAQTCSILAETPPIRLLHGSSPRSAAHACSARAGYSSAYISFTSTSVPLIHPGAFLIMGANGDRRKSPGLSPPHSV